jgi:hypothetical protein
MKKFGLRGKTFIEQRRRLSHISSRPSYHYDEIYSQ